MFMIYGYQPPPRFLMRAGARYTAIDMDNLLNCCPVCFGKATIDVNNSPSDFSGREIVHTIISCPVCDLSISFAQLDNNRSMYEFEFVSLSTIKFVVKDKYIDVYVDGRYSHRKEKSEVSLEDIQKISLLL